jgi:hypothetical protein
MEIDKVDPADTVFIQTNNAALNIGGLADEEMIITQGVLAFQNCGSLVDWNFLNTFIEGAGTLKAWNGTTYFAKNLFENGGQFEHNNGRVIFNQSYPTDLDVTTSIRFYDLELAKSSSHAVNISSEDEIIVENHYFSNYGYMNGPSSVIKCEKDAEFGPSHQRGTVPFKLVGPENSTLTINHTTLLHSDVEIIKDFPGSTVNIASDNPTLSTGNSDDTFTLTEGTVTFDTGQSTVHWNFLDTEINGGSWTCFTGVTNWKNNLTYNGGMWIHNSGTVSWTLAAYSVLDLQLTPQFHQMRIAKGSSRDITLGAGQKLVVEDLLELQYGLAKIGEIEAWSDVIVNPNWGGGDAQLSFRRVLDQTFDLTSAGALIEGIIMIDNTSGNVILPSVLNIEDNFAQLALIKGLVVPETPGSAVVRFEGGVDTGWSGGNNESYIDGTALKHGTGDMMLPMGHMGVFAPAGVSGNNTSTLWELGYRM